MIVFAYEDTAEDMVRTFPPPGAGRCSADIPEPMRSDLEEALLCASVSASKAAATMCRRAMDGATIQLGAKKARLWEQIDQLKDSGVLPPPLAASAHKVRIFGNPGAHPGADLLDTVSPEDAAMAIEFARTFMHYVYELPAQLARQDARLDAAQPESQSQG